jgi:hypothetical protein
MGGELRLAYQGSKSAGGGMGAMNSMDMKVQVVMKPRKHWFKVARVLAWLLSWTVERGVGPITVFASASEVDHRVEIVA